MFCWQLSPIWQKQVVRWARFIYYCGDWWAPAVAAWVAGMLRPVLCMYLSASVRCPGTVKDYE